MDDLSLRVYLENGSDAMRGGWLELPVVPERLDAFMRGVVGVDDGGGYAVVDHEPGWFGDVLGSDLESFSVSSLNLAARCVAHARDLAVADSVDGDVFLDMLATAAESEDVRFPSGIAALAARAGDVAEFWTEYSLPDSWRAGNSSPDELYGAHVAYGLMGDDAYSSLSYCMDLERLGRDEASNAGVTPGASGFVSDHEPLAPSGPVPDGALDALEAFASGWRPPSAEYRPFDIADIVCEGETVADYTLEGDGTNWGAPVYQCVVDDGFDAGSDVFGVDVLSALEDTLRRIRSARAGMGDFDEVAREVMGVEQFRPSPSSVPACGGAESGRVPGVADVGVRGSRWLSCRGSLVFFRSGGRGWRVRVAFLRPPVVVWSGLLAAAYAGGGVDAVVEHVVYGGFVSVVPVFDVGVVVFRAPFVPDGVLPSGVGHLYGFAFRAFDGLGWREPLDSSVLVDFGEFSLGSVREVGLSGLPCEYRVAAVARVSSVRVFLGDAVVGDVSVFVVAERVAERVRVLGVDGSVGGESEVD